MSSRLLPTLLLLCAPALAQETIHVDAHATAPGDGSAASPYQTIQEALDRPGISAADTVLVRPGVYAERLVMAVDGAQVVSTEGPAATTLVAPPGSFLPHLESRNEDVDGRICGFTFEGNGANAGIRTFIGGRLTVERCVMRGYGTALSNQYDMWVRNCTVVGNQIGYAHGCPTFPCGAFSFVDDSIFWDNAEDFRDNKAANLFLTRVLSGTDPKFFGPGDAHIRRISPAIDSGDPALIDPDGSRRDRGAYAYDPSWPLGAAECTGSVNSTGLRGRAFVWGSTSVAAGDLTVFGDRLPPNAGVLLFRGREAAALPLGQSTLCIAAPTLRVQVATTDANGQVAVPFDAGAPSLDPLQPGETARFQLWHRDPTGPDFFALTNAVRVTFTP